MRANEFFLEDRAEYIAKAMGPRLIAAGERDSSWPAQFQPLTAEKILDALKQIDPDPQAKNLQFIARMYSAGQFKFEDAGSIKDSIDFYLKNRNQLAVKDLNQIQNLDQLYDLIEPLQAAGAKEPMSKSRQEKEIKSNEVVIVMDTPNLKVVIPKTERASCLYGSNTKWCTASLEYENKFEEYSQKGPLWTILAKINGKPRKFQLHVEGDEFMNERNQEVSPTDIRGLSSIPEYKDFVNMLIKKYYGKYLNLDQAAPAK